MSENNNSTNSGGLALILFVVFLVLKLTHVIDWKWLWVASPIWLPIAAALGIGLVSMLIAYILNR